MLGAIIGDIVGSRFEFNNTSDFNFELFTDECDFTDDTICTIAVADAVINKKSYKEAMLEWCRKYPCPMGSYGGSFARWIRSSDPQPYGSFGNGSAMRVSSIGWLFNTRKEVMEEAKCSAEITHNHPEGVKGAQGVALAILLARKGVKKSDILIELKNLYPTFVEPLIGKNPFNETCQGTLPICLGIIEKADCFEEAIRYAIAVGGDSDTIGAIVGGIAEAIWGIPEYMQRLALTFLPNDMVNIYNQFLGRSSVDEAFIS